MSKLYALRFNTDVGSATAVIKADSEEKAKQELEEYLTDVERDLLAWDASEILFDFGIHIVWDDPNNDTM